MFKWDKMYYILFDVSGFGEKFAKILYLLSSSYFRGKKKTIIMFISK